MATLNSAPDSPVAPGLPGWKAAASSSPCAGTARLDISAERLPAPGLPGWTAPSSAATLDTRQSKTHANSRAAKILVAIVAVLVIAYVAGTISLASTLARGTWSRYDELTLELDFDGDSIEYSADMSWLGNYTIANYRYHVIAPNLSLVSYEGRSGWHLYTVNASSSMLTISPGLTDSSSSEYWFK